MDFPLFSTSAAHGFKDYEYPVHKSPETFRIFVLGDSLAFGQGVRMDEAFSKVLETLLNRRSRSRIYEVINSSVPGLNAVQEFCLQKTLGIHYEPDIFLVALCHNDAELYQPTSPDKYREHIDRIWNPEGPSYPYFVESLRRIKETAESHGSKVVVAYFVFCDESLAPQAPTVLAKTCQELGIPFTDTGGSTRKYPSKELWVNDTETHPNALAHRVTAQHLAEFLVAQGFLSPEEGNITEGEVIRKALDAQIGEPDILRPQSLTVPLARTFSLLRSKIQRRVFGEQAEGLLNKTEIEKALVALSPLLKRSQLLECLEGYDTYLRTASIQSQVPLFGLKQMLCDLQLSIFYIEMAHQRRSILPEMFQHAEQQPKPPDVASFQKAMEELARYQRTLGSFHQNLHRSFNGTLNQYQNLSEQECFLASELAKVARSLAQCAVRSERPFGLFVAEAQRVAEALRQAGEELAKELTLFPTVRESDFPEPDQFRRYSHFVWETVDFYLYVFEHFSFCLTEVNLLGLSDITARIADGKAGPWSGRDVEFEVTVHCASSNANSPDYGHLGIFWTNVVPIGAPQRDTLAIEADSKDHAYRFKFSTGVLGYFTLELKNIDHGHVRGIQMHLNGKCVRKWAGENLQRVLQSNLRSELLILNESD